MPNLMGDPFEPIETPSPGEGPGVPLRWWQMALITAPFVAMIAAALLYGR